MTNRSLLSTIVVAAALSLTGAASASAHAQLVRATPAAEGTVKTAPNEVTLKFNERLETAFSSIAVKDSAGKQVDKADAKVDPKDRTVIHVSLPQLEPGTYNVEWKAMSADTHKINGAFSFVIQP